MSALGEEVVPAPECVSRGCRQPPTHALRLYYLREQRLLCDAHVERLREEFPAGTDSLRMGLTPLAASRPSPALD